VGGFTREEYKSTFHSNDCLGLERVVSRPQPDSCIVLDTLYVVDTEAGKLESLPATGHEFRASFSAKATG